jgi:hypothetical protein
MQFNWKIQVLFTFCLCTIKITNYRANTASLPLFKNNVTRANTASLPLFKPNVTRANTASLPLFKPNVTSAILDSFLHLKYYNETSAENTITQESDVYTITQNRVMFTL